MSTERRITASKFTKEPLLDLAERVKALTYEDMMTLAEIIGAGDMEITNDDGPHMGEASTDHIAGHLISAADELITRLKHA